jgi:hypothetical protein
MKRRISRWTSVALVVLPTTSAQLIVIGVIGEYPMRRPLFVIQGIISSGELTRDLNPQQTTAVK